MRAVAQLVSYEVPQVLATIPVVLWAGSLSLNDIFNVQMEHGWFIFSPPGLLAFTILMIASVAEVNRTPFDLPEAESEIIAGYHTEYSGMRFGLFFLAEYLSVFGVSCLGTLLFLGGGSLPFTDFPASLINPQSKWLVYVLVNLVLVSVFALKLAVFVFLMFWIRVTLPRLRVDQLMSFAWKNLVPMSIVNIFAAAVWYECYMRSSRPFVLGGTTLSVPFLPMNWIISSLITSAILVPSLLVIRGINRQERKAALRTKGPATLSPTAPRLPAAAR
jgi:NADH-quinone oxidoreductase subunit H